jgi:ribosomal protein L37AE/L43A
MASERDPHGIVPDEFWEEYDSIESARKHTEKGDLDDRLRCPHCASTAIDRKLGNQHSECTHRRPEDYRCKNDRCYRHFDEPAPSARAEGVPAHEGCGKRHHVRRLDDGRYRCYRCDEIFEGGDGGGK